MSNVRKVGGVESDVTVFDQAGMVIIGSARVQKYAGARYPVLFRSVTDGKWYKPRPGGQVLGVVECFDAIPNPED
jgi:hypothetical protein